SSKATDPPQGGLSERSGPEHAAAPSAFDNAPVQALSGTERRRSRTYPAVGYTTSPVLKTTDGRCGKWGLCSLNRVLVGSNAIVCATVAGGGVRRSCVVAAYCFR